MIDATISSSAILGNVGLEIQLQDEFGGRIEGIIDPQNLLPGLLPSDEESDAYPMLSGVDLYGDTIFNRIQIPRFLSELARVASNAQRDEDRKLVSEIEMLARRCADNLHTYLKFIGD
jgi:hypothetical protein